MRIGLLAGMVLAATAAVNGASAMEAPMVVAGGELDPAFPGADVYRAEPRAPVVPPGRACALAQRYVELVNAGKYAEVAALYADDATFLEPMRPNLHGRAQIDEFYTKRIGGMQPTVAAVAYLGNDSECMVELALRTEMAGQQRYVLVSIDHFILNEEGRIRSMAAFARPLRQEQ